MMIANTNIFNLLCDSHCFKHVISSFIPNNSELGSTVIPILQMKKLRLNNLLKVAQLVRGMRFKPRQFTKNIFVRTLL